MGMITGTANAEYIFAGSDGDTLTGGAGSDTFVFRHPPSSQPHVITDFQHGIDHLLFSVSSFGAALLPEGGSPLISAPDPLQANWTGSNTGNFIFINSGAKQGTLYFDPTGGNGADAIPLIAFSGSPQLGGIDLRVDFTSELEAASPFYASSGNSIIDAMILGRETVSVSPADRVSTIGLTGYKWGTGPVGTGASLTYSFVDPAVSLPASYPPDGDGREIVPEVVRNSYRSALAKWAEVADLHFAEVADTSASFGILRLGSTTSIPQLSLGAGSAGPQIPPDVYGTVFGGDTWTSPATISAFDWNPGGRGSYLMLHETGHSVIGLSDTSDLPGLFGTVLPRDLNDRKSTLMSFASLPGATIGDILPGPNHYDYWPTSPMVLDIQAAQYIYGVNSTHNRGDNTYFFDATRKYFETIWDAGGIDVVSIAGQAGGGVIDLRPGHYSDVGTVVIATDGSKVEIITKTVGIAYGAVIENAVGGNGADSLIGNDVANRLTGGAGNDLIEGGRSLDTAIFARTHTSYTITLSGSQALVIDNSGGDGSDTLVGVERLEFSDGTIAFDTGAQQNAGMAYRVYQAAFNRAPDTPGLGYWIRALDAGEGDLAWVALNFIISDEFKTTYGTPSSVTNSQFLNLLYANVLHREPDAPGLAYWQNAIASGFARERILASFSESVENQANVIGSIEDGVFYT